MIERRFSIHYLSLKVRLQWLAATAGTTLSGSLQATFNV
jgi:hypothetical protein